MHPECMDFLRSTIETAALDQKLHPVPKVLEFGSYNVNGSAREIFNERTGVLVAVEYVGVDVVPGPGVDVVADAADYNAHALFDLVISCEVLEHAHRWREIVANMQRHLAPGGLMVLTAASDPRHPHSAVDGHNMEPYEWTCNPIVMNEGNREWYDNIDPSELRSMLSGMEFESYEVSWLHRGDVQAEAWAR